MKTNLSYFEVHTLTRALLLKFLKCRYSYITKCKGFISLPTICYTADVLTSYNELSGLDFFISFRNFPVIAI